MQKRATTFNGWLQTHGVVCKLHIFCSPELNLWSENTENKLRVRFQSFVLKIRSKDIQKSHDFNFKFELWRFKFSEYLFKEELLVSTTEQFPPPQHHKSLLKGAQHVISDSLFLSRSIFSARLGLKKIPTQSFLAIKKHFEGSDFRKLS